MTYLWFQENRARLARELVAVEQLRKARTWLIQTEWAVNTHLSLTAVIRAHDHDYYVRMDYPAYFPDVPPTVRPINADVRWTSHQYGDINGPLCLEWGPDTWQVEVTGAHMLESAYNLFHIENPLGQGRTEYINPAPSRHYLTPGQILRFKWGRFYLGSCLQSVLHALPDCTLAMVRFSVSVGEHSWFVLVHEIEVPGALPVHIDNTIPPFLRGVEGSALMLGAFFKTDLCPEAFSDLKAPFHLRALLWKNGFDVGMLSKEVKPNCLGFTHRPIGVLVLDNADCAHFFMLTDHKLHKLGAVHTAISAGVKRMPDHLENLSGRSIGIVGLGSAGSKIAVSLARMGVASFYLVDSDVFLPENVERNELNWESVGEHKVDAVRDLLVRVNAKAGVVVSHLHLTGQESTSAVAEVIEQLSRCDLIIDATANPTAFNMLAAVTTAAKKPMVWLEVFGGGAGGLIGRSRPDRDPEPQLIRQAYLAYCLEHPAPEGAPIGNYVVEDTDGIVQTASDADVSIIAAHATRLAVDAILAREPSAYAYSLYLIGLAPWWVFTQAMETIPIQIDHLRSEGAFEESDVLIDEHIQALINRLLSKTDVDANPTTP